MLTGCGEFGVEADDNDLFIRALTHGSTGEADYQRLEFLGDRVLGLMIADMLYDRFPDEPEGRLSHRLNSLVAGVTCAEIARKIDVLPHLRLGKQARDDGARESDNVLGDVMEALVGALISTQWIGAARALIETALATVAGGRVDRAQSIPNRRCRNGARQIIARSPTMRLRPRKAHRTPCDLK